MSKNTSTIFLKNLVNINHLWATKDKNTLQGSSVSVSFEITYVNSHNLVVDFSFMEELLKSFLYNKFGNVNHKLWVFKSAWSFNEVNGNLIVLANDSIKLSLPVSDVYQVDEDFDSYSNTVISKIIEREVTNYLSTIYFGELVVVCTVDSTREKGNQGESTKYFNYVACYANQESIQLKGYTSCVTFSYNSRDIGVIYQINLALEQFIRDVKDCIFLRSDNIAEKDLNDDVDLRVSLKPHNSRLFDDLNKSANKIIALDEFCSIEHLARELPTRFCDLEKLKTFGVTKISISEGLKRGAILYL